MKTWGDDEVEFADEPAFEVNGRRVRMLDNGNRNMRRFRGQFGVIMACEANSRRLEAGELSDHEEEAYALRAPPSTNEYGANIAGFSLDKWGTAADAGLHTHLG